MKKVNGLFKVYLLCSMVFVRLYLDDFGKGINNKEMLYFVRL